MEAVPITFFKSYEQRLEELKLILCEKSTSPVFSCTKVDDLWSIYVELYIEPVGWQALWKISRELCAELKLKFPTNVVIEVEAVDYKELTANITVTNVESPINIPEKFEEVPLIELFPLAEQDNQKVMLIENTAEAIDHLRIFYCYLYYPWETEDDETNWVDEHLENRLSLHYEMISSKIFHETADELKNLINKGKTIFQEIKDLEEIVVETEGNFSTDENTLKLFELRHDLEHVKNQLSIFDNASLRDLKMKKNRAKLIETRHQTLNLFSFVVVNGGNIKELTKYVSELKLIIHPDMFLSPLNSLQEALNLLEPHGTILIGPGIHKLYNCRGLQENATELRGFTGRDKCIISEAEENWALFDLRGAEVKFHDLTIQSSRVKYMIIVRKGVCRLNNVVLQGSHSAVGVMVHSGATLYATRCNFVSCTIGIVANPGSNVNLKECILNKNKVAIEAQENSDIFIESCTIADSSEYAVQVNQSELARKEGPIDLLSASGSINVKDLNLVHNFGDVLVECVKPDYTLNPNVLF